MEENIPETILVLDVKEIHFESGVQNINSLIKLYLKDKTLTAFEAYNDNKMAISDFINEFERLLNKAKQYGANIS